MKKKIIVSLIIIVIVYSLYAYESRSVLNKYSLKKEEIDDYGDVLPDLKEITEEFYKPNRKANIIIDSIFYDNVVIDDGDTFLLVKYYAPINGYTLIRYRSVEDGEWYYIENELLLGNINRIVKQGENVFVVKVDSFYNDIDSVKIDFWKISNWEYYTGRYSLVHSYPVAYNNMLFVGSTNGYIYALNRYTGKLIWKYKTNYYVESSPFVYDGIVYIGSEDHYFYALDTKTGELIWKYKTGDCINSNPIVYNGIVYIGSDDYYFYALDAKTGELMWRYKTNKRIKSSPCVYNGIIYVGSTDYHVYAFDANLGKLIWKYKTDGYIDASLTVYEDKLYITDGRGDLYALNAKTGELIWKYDAYYRDIDSKPIVKNNIVYIGIKDYVCAINANNGKLIWKHEMIANDVKLSPNVSDEGLYVVREGWNDIYLLDFTTGEEIKKYNVGGAIYSAPFVTEGMLYVGGSRGVIRGVVK